jgi:hypothetical protein
MRALVARAQSKGAKVGMLPEGHCKSSPEGHSFPWILGSVRLCLVWSVKYTKLITSLHKVLFDCELPHSCKLNIQSGRIHWGFVPTGFWLATPI